MRNVVGSSSSLSEVFKAQKLRRLFNIVGVLLFVPNHAVVKGLQQYSQLVPC